VHIVVVLLHLHFVVALAMTFFVVPSTEAHVAHKLSSVSQDGAAVVVVPSNSLGGGDSL
jgi:hypothetical protein